MVTYERQRIRIPIDVTKPSGQTNKLTGEAPWVWRGSDVSLELLFQYSTDLLDVSNIQSLSTFIKPGGDRDGNAIATPAAITTFDNTVVQSTWDDDTKQHCVVNIENADTNVDLSGQNQQSYWVVFEAVTTSGKRITLGGFTLVIHENGVQNPGTPSGNPSYYTDAQSDARFPIVFDNVAALKAYTPDGIDPTVRTLGYYAAWDRGHGEYHYDPDSVAADNGITILEPDSGVGRWIRVCSGPPNPAWAGLVEGTGADPVANTVAVQRAIDLAIDIGATEIVVDYGHYLLGPWDAAATSVLVCSYTDHTGSAGMLSSTNPVTPRFESPSRKAIRIQGAGSNKRLARLDTDPDQIHNVGTVFQFIGDMEGVVGIASGFHQRGFELGGITLIGTGRPVTGSIGIRHDVTSGFMKLDDVALLHWETAIDLGGNHALAESLADHNYIDFCYVDHCDVGLNVGFAGATPYITNVHESTVLARIPIKNTYPFDSNAAQNSVHVRVSGGFVGPTVEYGGILLEGTVDSSPAADKVRVTLTTKKTKVRDASFVLSLSSVAGDINDVEVGMLVYIAGNCTAHGAARPTDYAVCNRVTAVDVGTGDLTLSGFLETTDIADRTIYVVKPAIAFHGDYISVTGTHVEQEKDADFGFGPMLAFATGRRSVTQLQSVRVNLSNVDSGFNRIQAKIVHESILDRTAINLSIEDCVLNGTFWKAQVTSAKNVAFARNVWNQEPIIINPDGDIPGGLGEVGRYINVKHRSETTSGGTEHSHPEQYDQFVHRAHVGNRPIPLATNRFSAATPTRIADGETVFDGRSHGVASVIGWRGAMVGGVSGVYDATADITATGDIDIAVNAHLVTVSNLTGLYRGRVITIAGAGVAAADLTSRIVDVIGSSDLSTKQIWIADAASTTVVGAAITRVSPIAKTFGRQAHFDSAAPASGTWERGDIAWNSAVGSHEPVGWVCISAGTPGLWRQFGWVDEGPAFVTISDGDTSPNVFSITRLQTNNSGATTITTFDNGFDGQVIYVVFGDAITTIDFTGTNLKGNGGVDWTPAAGDHMTCVYDGTNWHCSVSNNT